MKKEFESGIPLTCDTEYFATKAEYHVYDKDTITVCDDRYIALRANDTKDFAVFMYIKGKRNITVDFCGATLVMHGKIQPFLIDSSENITIKNCNVIYDRPPYTEALITEVTPSYVRLRLNVHCPCRIEDGKLIPYCETWENQKLNYNNCYFQLFDAKTCKGCGLHLGVMGNSVVTERKVPYAVTHFIVEPDGEDVLLKGTIPEFYQPGMVLVIAHETRSLSSVFMIDSKNMHIENFRIMTGWGMGIYTYRTEDITLNGIRMTHDEKSPCIVTNAADAIHSFGTSGKFEILNSVIEGMIDDAVNIHSNFRTVSHVFGNEIYTNLASCERQADELYREGDLIAIYRGKTMEETARYTIRKVENVDGIIKKFIVDRPVIAHNKGDLIESITANCDVTIDNCVFGKANSHLRFQSRGKFLMRNCATELPIMLTGDASYWFESGPITDLTIENCSFIGNHARILIRGDVFPTEAEPYYHKNIKILNNQFEAELPMQAGFADGIVFKGNQNSAGKQMKLVLTSCGSLDADGCEVERKFEIKKELPVR